MNEGSTKAKSYFPSLTGVRIVAAWLVFFHHYNPFSVERFGSFLNQFGRELHVGVSIFFVLSGFLITHRYFKQAESFNWRAYLMNRVARVYPMYFIMTTLAFVIGSESSWSVYFLNITFLRGFFDDLKFTLVSQGWSLTVEECFYLLAPLIFLVLRKTRYALLVLPAFFISLGIVLVIIFGSRISQGFFANYSFMFIYTFFGRCFEFFWGIALALYLKQGARPSSLFTWIGILAMTVLIVIMSQFGSAGLSGVQSNYGIVINNFLLPMAITLFFYGLIQEQSWLKALLSTKLFTLLGKSSYTFYLIHLGVMSTWLDSLVSGNLMLLFLLLNVAALVLWRFLDEPLNRIIRSWNTT